MKKTTLILVISAVLVMIIAFCYKTVDNDTELPEKTLVRSFNSSGAAAVSSEIYFWGKLSSSKKSIDELKSFAVSFSKDLGMDQNEISSNVIKNDSLLKVELSGFYNNRTISLNVQQDSKGEDEGGFISVNVGENSANSGLENIRNDISNVFKKYNISPKINSCITGSYDGKLDNNLLNLICERVFKEAEAEKVEGISDKNLMSVSAYSPVINDFIKINNKKINLNLAIRYNSLENKTYIWLATPVITTEY